MPIHHQYTSEIHEQLNYNATWLPTVRLVPGDICRLDGHEIQVVSHLNEFGVTFELEDRPVESDFEYSSAGVVSLHSKLSGQPPPAGSMLALTEAGISLSFARSEAVVLRLAQCSAKRLKSIHQVGEQILKLNAQGKWPEGYVVVTEAVTAGASTIIISNGKDAGLDLAAKADAGAGPLTLASLDAGWQVKRESKIGAKFISLPGLTPLVRVSGIQKRFLRPDQFRSPKGSGPSAASGQPVAFGSVDYTDYGA